MEEVFRGAEYAETACYLTGNIYKNFGWLCRRCPPYPFQTLHLPPPQQLPLQCCRPQHAVRNTREEQGEKVINCSNREMRIRMAVFCSEISVKAGLTSPDSIYAILPTNIPINGESAALTWASLFAQILPYDQGKSRVGREGRGREEKTCLILMQKNWRECSMMISTTRLSNTITLSRILCSTSTTRPLLLSSPSCALLPSRSCAPLRSAYAFSSSPFPLLFLPSHALFHLCILFFSRSLPSSRYVHSEN